MAGTGKEDPMVNFLAAGLEKVEVAAFSPQPLPDEDEKDDCQCHIPTVEEEEKPCTAEVKTHWASTGEHRRPPELEVEAEAEAADKASVNVADVESATANVFSEELPEELFEMPEDYSEELSEELVEMPEDYLNWLLAQTRETDPVPSLDDYYSTRDPVKLKRLQEEIEWLQAEQDDFFRYQDWARRMLEKHGRVMIPKGEISREEFQESINEYWYGLLEECGNAACSKTEVGAAAEPSN